MHSKRSRMTSSRAGVLVALALAGAVAHAAAAPLGGRRAASASAASRGLRGKNASALAAAAQIRRLQAGGDADRLLAFKASGNGAGLESWAAGSEPCGAGWDSWTEGWTGVKCNAAGGSVWHMCAPQPLPCQRAASCLCSHKLPMGCRSMHTSFGIPSSLTADIAALAGLSLTTLRAPIPRSICAAPSPGSPPFLLPSPAFLR